MKFYVNADDETSGWCPFIIKYLKKLDCYTTDTDYVINMCSINRKGILRGKKLTIYIETDNFMTLGGNKNLYDIDLLYISEKKYLSYYPSYTKTIIMGVDEEFHRPMDVEKKYDYVFVGNMSCVDVYDNRRKIIGDLQKVNSNILVTQGSREDYPKLMSSGKIILNVLPRRGENACANMRFFEGMAMGCLMTDYDPVLDLYATRNVHYVGLDKFGKMSDEEIRKIAKVGREHMLKNFTYKRGVEQIISDCLLHEREKKNKLDLI